MTGGAGSGSGAGAGGTASGGNSAAGTNADSGGGNLGQQLRGGRPSGIENRGSNARGAQRFERRELAPGERRSNARGAQGPERGRSSTTAQGRDRTNRSGTARQTRSERFGQNRERPSTIGQGGTTTEIDRTGSEINGRTD